MRRGGEEEGEGRRVEGKGRGEGIKVISNLLDVRYPEFMFTKIKK